MRVLCDRYDGDPGDRYLRFPEERGWLTRPQEPNGAHHGEPNGVILLLHGFFDALVTFGPPLHHAKAAWECHMKSKLLLLA